MKVGVLMGSANDADKMKGAVEVLREFDVEVTEHVMSAHRTPERVQAFASSARDNGYAAIICVTDAGLAKKLTAYRDRWRDA